MRRLPLGWPICCVAAFWTSSLRADEALTPATTAPAEAQEKPSAPPAASPDEIKQWIAELASDQFEVREAATKHLETAGAGAVAPLSRAALGGELETTYRALQALEGIARVSERETFESVQSVLERLAESPRRSVARRA